MKMSQTRRSSYNINAHRLDAPDGRTTFFINRQAIYVAATATVEEQKKSTSHRIERRIVCVLADQSNVANNCALNLSHAVVSDLL